MVSRFRRPNADLSIGLDDGPHRLGQAINGRITLLPGEGFQMRGGQLEFICTETYWERVVRHTRMGSAETNEMATTVIRQYSQPLFADTTIANLMPQVSDIVFTIPEDAPPTVAGVLAKLTWTLRATVDVARGRDISQEIELVVLPVPAEASAGPGISSEVVPPATSEYRQCDLILSLQSSRVRMGETVDGTLRVLPKQGTFQSTIKIELMRLETAGSSQADRIVDSHEFPTSQVAGIGDAMELPFSFHVPEGLISTISVHETSISWRVQATIPNGREDDMVVSQRFTVRSSL